MAAMKVGDNNSAEGGETVNRIFRKEGKFQRKKSKSGGNGKEKSMNCASDVGMEITLPKTLSAQQKDKHAENVMKRQIC